MFPMLENLTTIRDLLLVCIGFGLIVFVHELGHFLAARWAGIRVLAFAIGFGPALFSYRKGMGLRAGSGEKEYMERVKREREGIQPRSLQEISPTEYRFNLLPLGGYVKMLGQEDTNPNAVSDAPDSYQMCKPTKRMVVISAGVIMNLITAAVLFIGVFMIGLSVEPAKIGFVAPGSPAATTVPSNAAEAGVTAAGLRPGDEVVSVNGRTPNSFNDLTLETAMSGPKDEIRMTVRRPGVARPLTFSVKPEPGKLTGLLEMGVGPSFSTQLVDVKDSELEAWHQRNKTLGIGGLEPGAVLVAVDGVKARDANGIGEAVRKSGGRAVEAEFRNKDGSLVTLAMTPVPEFETDVLARRGNTLTVVEHLLGLMPVLRVDTASEDAKKQGLKSGDVFARVADVEFPSPSQGIRTITANKGKTIPVVLLRETPEGRRLVKLDVKVNRKGQIGFLAGDVGATEALVALPYGELRRPREEKGYTPAAAEVIVSPGTRIVGVNDLNVKDFATLRSALLDVTKNATDGATVNLRVQRPVNGEPAAAEAQAETFQWTLKQADIGRLRALGWESPYQLPFEPEQIKRQAAAPIEAIKMGLAETRRVMLTTYVTFARLAQGTVKVEHLKGPVGIAHLGTLVASKGMIHLLFFMALISINLAVINFLPLPIVDGGQFLFLIYEQVRGRPVPIGFQNAVTMAGLVLIAGMFLMVTFNDISNLLGF
jgi:regulator of sigma E protease